jgi:hypothetical protein
MTGLETLLNAHAHRHNSTAVNGVEAGCVREAEDGAPSSELLSSSRILKFYVLRYNRNVQPCQREKSPIKGVIFLEALMNIYRVFQK